MVIGMSIHQQTFNRQAFNLFLTDLKKRLLLAENIL